MGRITTRTRSPDRASRVREADHRRSESGAAAAVGDWDRDFATHPADLAGGRQSIVCFFLFLFTLYTQMYYSCWLDCRVCPVDPPLASTDSRNHVFVLYVCRHMLKSYVVCMYNCTVLLG